ncbi:MAG: hypothetical protein QG673_1073 [Pseudomonadota bacterium]|nr:hypothetical protein [Pseudomonadota bacterium]
MDYGLDNLLNLDGLEYTYESGHWYKIEARQVELTSERPHGIRYSLTLHDKYNKRIFGMDNAHSIKPGKKFTVRLITYDHLHKNKVDKGTPYEFESAEKLLQDFFDHINKILGNIK